MIEFLQNLTNPDWIMAHGGLYIVLFIVFAETGLFVGFFLPGDSLLFITGIIIANTALPGLGSLMSLIYWLLLISAAGIAGNFIGYWFGRTSGDMLMKRKDSWLFKKKHLLQAKEFYMKRGGAAIVLARFLPIIRTFAPIVAGMVRMDFRKFSLYNVLGSFAWVVSLVTAGYLLGENMWVKNNLEKIILGIIIIPLLPVLIKLVFGKKPKVQALPVVDVNNEQVKKQRDVEKNNSVF
jgi:membrane-associated protein